MNHQDTNEATPSEYSDERLKELTDKLIEMSLSNVGQWVEIDKQHGEKNAQIIFDRVRNVLKLMGIHYSIPDPSMRTRFGSRVTKVYSIKVMSEKQLDDWRKQRKQNGTFSERHGFREPTWRDDWSSF